MRYPEADKSASYRRILLSLFELRHAWPRAAQRGIPDAWQTRLRDDRVINTAAAIRAHFRLHAVRAR